MARGILSRMANVIKVEVDDALQKLEDPKKMVRQMILDMEQALEEAVVAVGRSVANEKLLERQIKEKREEEDLWERKAEGAVAVGEDALARQALKQKVEAAGQAADLEKALAEAREVSATLKTQLTRFKAKLASAKSRGASLAMKRGAGQRGESATGQGMMRLEAFDRFDQFCQDITRDEVAAEVYEEILGEKKPAVDDAFEKLEQKKRIDDALAALKAKASQEQK